MSAYSLYLETALRDANPTSGYLCIPRGNRRFDIEDLSGVDCGNISRRCLVGSVQPVRPRSDLLPEDPALSAEHLFLGRDATVHRRTAPRRRS